MRITDIQKTPSLGRANRNWSLLKILTDEGIEGIGEWRGGGSVDGLKQALIGRDPMNINQLHHDRLWQMKGPGAGVEIALWDLKGKSKPCATIPNFLALEYHSANIPLWSTMLHLKNPIVEGYMAVPEGPGLGIELDEAEILKHVPEGAPLWS